MTRFRERIGDKGELYHKARVALVRLAKRYELPLRQSYERLSESALRWL